MGELYCCIKISLHPIDLGDGAHTNWGKTLMISYWHWKFVTVKSFEMSAKTYVDSTTDGAASHWTNCSLVTAEYSTETNYWCQKKVYFLSELHYMMRHLRAGTVWKTSSLLNSWKPWVLSVLMQESVRSTLYLINDVHIFDLILETIPNRCRTYWKLSINTSFRPSWKAPALWSCLQSGDSLPSVEAHASFQPV